MEQITNTVCSFFEQVDSFFEKKCKEDIKEYFEIAGRVFLMEFEDWRMREYFIWQMKLFLTEKTDFCGKIRIWTDTRAGELSVLKQRVGKLPTSVQTKQGSVSFYVFGKGKRIGELVFAWSKERKTGWVLIEPEQLENFYQRSFMLTPLFSRMAPDFGLSLIHGAAVGLQGQGVILSGLSGAGKSSLAAACLMSGMQYVSDDTMFLDLQNGKAYPMCSTIHLAPEILKIFHEISGEEFSTRNGRGEKRHLDISFLKEQFAQELEIKAQIILRIDDSADFGIRPVNWEKAAVPLIFSSAHLLGEEQNAPAVRSIVSCMRRLPAYEFYMSGNLRYNAGYLKKFITDHYLEGGDENVQVK